MVLLETFHELVKLFLDVEVFVVLALHSDVGFLELVTQLRDLDLVEAGFFLVLFFEEFDF